MPPKNNKNSEYSKRVREDTIEYLKENVNEVYGFGVRGQTPKGMTHGEASRLFSTNITPAKTEDDEK